MLNHIWRCRTVTFGWPAFAAAITMPGGTSCGVGVPVSMGEIAGWVLATADADGTIGAGARVAVLTAMALVAAAGSL